MNMKRMRGRNHRGTGGGGGAGPIRHHSGNIPLNRNHVFDSNGPDVRVRGTAQQLFEKYLQLGRDATSSGDRVTAESYFQHAEHYFRILNAINQAAQQNQPQAYNGQGGAQAYGQGGYGQGSTGRGAIRARHPATSRAAIRPVRTAGAVRGWEPRTNRMTRPRAPATSPAPSSAKSRSPPPRPRPDGRARASARSPPAPGGG